jgi:hypothetical protein
MDKRIVRLLFWLVCVLIARSGRAQGCRVDYTPNYALYVTESTDGTKIYTTVLSDGSTTGTGGAGCNYPSATHTAVAYNTIGSVNSKMNGSPGCMTCYLSVQNDQEIVGTPGVIYVFTGSTNIICSVFGTFWSNLFSTQIEVAATHSKVTSTKPSSGGYEICNVTSWCTAATTPPDCNPSFVAQAPLIAGGTASCLAYYDTVWLATRPAAGQLWNCYPPIPGESAEGSTNASLVSCIRNK